MNQKSIWLCFASCDSKNAQRLIQSIIAQIKAFNHNGINLLVIDKTKGSSIKEILDTKCKNYFSSIIYYNLESIFQLEQLNIELYKNINYPFPIDSIQRARIQLMLAINQHFELFKESIIWQLDDDMLFYDLVYKEKKIKQAIITDFFKVIREYNRKYPDIDAAIGKCSLVPPLPILLYFLNQFIDLVSVNATQNFNLKFNNDFYYHDLYVDLNTIDQSKQLDKNQIKKLDNLLKGQVVSRPVIFENLFPLNSPKKKSILRGGNFIIFNSNVAIAFPHLSMIQEGVPSRRSDMIHAFMLSKVGFNIIEIDLPLIHNREIKEINIKHAVLSYKKDIIGSLSLRLIIDGKQNCMKRYQKHIIHIKNIIHFIIPYKKQHPRLEELEVHLLNLVDELESFDWVVFFKQSNALKSLVNKFIKDDQAKEITNIPNWT